MINLLYLPTARLTFDVETAERIFWNSLSMLADMPFRLIAPKKMLTNPEDLNKFITERGGEADIVLFQHITFADGDFIAAVQKQMDVPIILWAVNEPSIGGRLRLNSMTGIMSSANALMNRKRPYLFVLGDASDADFRACLQQKIAVAMTIQRLKLLRVGVIGDYPPGFFFSAAAAEELKAVFGTEIFQYALDELLEEALKISKEEYQPELDFAKEHVKGVQTQDEVFIRFAQVTAAVKKRIAADSLGSLAIRCWPDFFQTLSAAPCGVFSQLTEQDIPVGCECDIHGSLSMFILKELSAGHKPYMGDIVNVIAEDNSIILWHCGFAPYSAANPGTGAVAGIHPNRKIGYAMDFAIAPGKVTLFRVGHSPQGYRLIAMNGTALDVDNQYMGTSARIRLQSNAEKLIAKSIEDGYEPHFAMIHGDILSSLQDLGHFLGIETIIL